MKTSETTSNCQVIQTSVKNCVTLNKGNTCYINATLQCLSTMVQFWSSFNFSVILKTRSPYVSSFVKIIVFLKSSKSAIDRSQFLRFLKQVLVKSGRPYFNIFQQQVAGKVLACILDELCDFILALDLVQVNTKVIIDCLSCHQSIDNEDFFDHLSAVFFRFIFNARTSFRRQFFFV